MKDMIDAIDTSYQIYHYRHFQMPTRMQVSNDENTLLLMPCFIDEAIGTKLVTSFPNNKNHPTLHGLLILNNRENGEIKAIMDGTFLTGFRTGAIGGSAVRHLTDSNAQKVAIIGTGVQGLYQAVAACTERTITDIYLYNRTAEKIPAFITSLQNWIGTETNIHTLSSAEQAIIEADIIITSTTSNEPVLPNNSDLLRDKLTIGIGSFQPSMRELPQSLYEVADLLLVDSEDAIKESGDIAGPLEQGWITHESIQTMANYLALKNDKILHQQKTILFKSTGMALFDVVAANVIYQRAAEKGIGQQLN